jgi:CheY-like chemotaxis protein
LSRLVNDVLDLSKIESGKMKWEKRSLSMAEVVEVSIKKFLPFIKQKNLQLRISIKKDLPKIYGDRDRLIQVVTNLLDNAIKFTPSKGIIEILLDLIHQPEPFIYFKIKDTGIGIPREKIGEIFDKFKQIKDDTGTKPAGTGLGLSICKGILEHHGGKIWVESEPNKGAIFFFALPIQGELKETETLQTEEKVLEELQESMIKKKILIIDDEPYVIRSLSFILKKAGFEVSSAKNGIDALQRCKEEKFDLVFVDLMLPELNGFEVITRLKEDFGQDCPKIIVLTARGEDSDRKKCAEFIDDYMVKPFAPTKVIKKVCELLNCEMKNFEETQNNE